MSRPGEWETLYDPDEDAAAVGEDGEDFHLQPIPHQRLVAVTEQSRAYVVPSRHRARDSFGLLATEEHISLDGVNDLVGLLIGLPNVLPAALLDGEGSWVCIPVRKQDELTDRQALWHVGDDLVVAADRDGIQLRWPNMKACLATLDAERAWALVLALASARRWHDTIPDLCGGCGVDVRLSGHLPNCGT